MSTSILLSVLSLLGAGRITTARADDAIELWTNYAIYPKRCVHYNNNDQIVYAIYEQAANHCVDTPAGTYVASVPTFVHAYLEQAADNAADAGEEYEYPAASSYLDCTLQQIAGVNYYVQLGCSDYDATKLAVNIYSDAQCTVHSHVDGYDDSNLAVDFSVSFGKCVPCVVWFDKNADDIDDQYYVNKQMNAPLCSAMWEYKQTCDKSCQKMGNLASSMDGWNKADKVLLTILSFFGEYRVPSRLSDDDDFLRWEVARDVVRGMRDSPSIRPCLTSSSFPPHGPSPSGYTQTKLKRKQGFGMLLAITKKRQKMSNKDALLEQAAISAAGLQQSHVLGIFALLILIITIFGLLGLKKITWALLLILNVVLFGYLMKLTLDGSVKETIIGPDGKIVEMDDSDDEDDADVTNPENSGPGYENPTSPLSPPAFSDKAIV